MKPWVVWTSRVLSAIPVLMLLLSGVMKIMHGPQVVEAFIGKYGWPERLLAPLGVIEVLCTLIYVVPQTAVLGAVLMTGYLGGAIATEVRIGSPNFIGPLVFGIFVWGGLWLRELRLRPLMPLRR